MKIKLLIVFFLVFIKNYSQVNFSESTILDKSHYSVNISSIVSEDLNNDGYKELIVGSSYDNQIMFYKNINGDIQANQRVLLFSIPNYSAYTISDIKCADIDNDGLKDIIVASSYEDKVYWFKNLGNYSFSTLQIIAQNIDKPTSLAIGDIDNDGDNDIIVGVYNDENISLFRNNGNGNFNSQQIIYTTSYGPNKVELYDLDNNGFLDIVSGQEDGSIRWSQNTNGFFFSISQYITGSADDGTGFDFLDINNDTYLDIVFSSNYDNKIRYSLNVNGSSFSTSMTAIDNSIQYPYQVHVYDMDNDGFKDIIVSAFANSTSFIGWYKNNDNGNFSILKTVTTNISNPLDFIVADLNNNNKPEIITCSYDSSSVASKRKLSLFEYNSISQSYVEKIINFNFTLLTATKVVDIDNDGYKDIISGFHNSIVYSKNLGNNTYSSYKNITGINTVMDYAYDLEVGDFNNDNFIDIMWINKSGITIYKNNGDGTFSNIYNLPLSLQYSLINAELGDLNNDGKLDFVLSYSDGGQTKLFSFIQTNNFTFQTPQQILITNLNEIKLGDLNNDGKIDIIGSQYSNFIWLKNDGSGNFIQQASIHMPLDANTVQALADIDNDGDLDLVCSTNYAYDSRKLYFIKNNINSFSSPVLIDTQGCSSLVLGDINNDGYLDIIGTSYKAYTPYSEKIFYYLNNSGTSFSSQIAVEDLGTPQNPSKQLVITDINNDNKMDIICGYNSISQVKVFLNTSLLSNSEINAITKSDKILIYPNPAYNEINLDIKFKIKKINIVDSAGRMIFNYRIDSNKIIIKDLKSGLYFINVFSEDNKIYTSKFLKHN